ncbi:unnamed protein product [Cuscuta epithymum]|uniref:Uncharacterized protein n=1 Tax=Cuscuta epithymum TaxID=186058 RepID=A0AAV0E9W6_9ASTE|nr:unnamed protein product [Cuscuta epithymum]
MVKRSSWKESCVILLQESFWKSVVYDLKLAGPLVKVLRTVEGERKPIMGYIYEAMDRVKETIAKTFGEKEDAYKKTFEMIDERWQCQLHQPLHAAGLYLNPEFFYDDSERIMDNEEVMNGLYACIARLVHDVEGQDKAIEELGAYSSAQDLHYGKP